MSFDFEPTLWLIWRICGVCVCLCVCVCVCVCVCLCLCVCRPDDSSSLVISSLASDELPDELQRTNNALRRSVHVLLGCFVYQRSRPQFACVISLTEVNITEIVLKQSKN